MTLSAAEFNARSEMVAAAALADEEPGEAIMVLCCAIARISRAAGLSDRGTRTAVDSLMHHMLPL
jgi:hypothetical protein